MEQTITIKEELVVISNRTQDFLLNLIQKQEDNASIKVSIEDDETDGIIGLTIAITPESVDHFPPAIKLVDFYSTIEFLKTQDIFIDTIVGSCERNGGLILWGTYKK